MNNIILKYRPIFIRLTRYVELPVSVINRMLLFLCDLIILVIASSCTMGTFKDSFKGSTPSQINLLQIIGKYNQIQGKPPKY